MAGKHAKALRMDALSQWLIEGMSQIEIAHKLGVSRPTISRLLAQRKKQFLATLNERQLETFNFLVRKSLDDFADLGEQIAQQEKFSLVVTDAYGKRAQIARNLARFLGIESTVKIQQNNFQLNDNRRHVSLNGPVQIIIEANNGEFDPEYGSFRVEHPSAGDLAASGG
jgi:hypothetical protein